jgi:nucleotide-binding universal stress UspA family protein
MYRKILVPLDGSPTSARGLEEAIGLARASGASLVLLHVIDVFPLAVEMATPDTWEKVVDGLRRHGQNLLDRAETTAREHGVASAARLLEFPTGRVADAILQEAKAADCDLILMGTHGRRGFSHMMMGSDAERVVHESPLPVLLIRHPDSKRT